MANHEGARNEAVALPPPSTSYRRYALCVLLFVFVLNHLDRQVINILAEPIKHDLGIKDWQIGLMTGFAFAMLYTVAGLPIAHLAGFYNRSKIIAASVLIWSAFTASSGFAQNFSQLVLCRVGVGVGEAGCTPPAQSLIVDDTPKTRRASALSVYHMGVPIGSLFGLALGGLLLDAFGWRVAFVAAGAPGILMALVVLLTIRDRRAAAKPSSPNAQRGQFATTLRVLASKRTFWLLSLATAFKAFIGYGHAPFTASFFFRVHGEELAALAAGFGLKPAGFLGLTLGLIFGLAGVSGAWIGGRLADHAATRDVRAYMSVPAIAAVATIPFTIAAFLADSALLAIMLLVIPSVLNHIWYGPVHTAQQSLVPPHMRAMATAVLLFVLNLIGLGLGPITVGLISDYLAGPGELGPGDGVRWALVLSSLIGLLTFGLFWMARKTIREELIS